jgi:ribulose-phosphate 3-epimerase
MTKIAPSFLSADFSNLERDIRAVEDAGVEYIHLDVMDAHFVPNLTFGPLVVDAVRKKTDLTLDVHLMITDPRDYLKPFADSGADILTVHVEIEDDLPDLLQAIRKAGMKSGASVKPGTPVETLLPLLPDLDLALVMSVEPGFGGQSFMADMLPKATAIRAEVERKGLSTEIEIDGGITTDTAGQATGAGVEVLVAGSAVFKGGKIRENVAAIRRAAESGMR